MGGPASEQLVKDFNGGNQSIRNQVRSERKCVCKSHPCHLPSLLFLQAHFAPSQLQPGGNQKLNLSHIHALNRGRVPTIVRGRPDRLTGNPLASVGDA
jgi:hypothetical protein